jgi:hypothetical protein
MFPAKGKDLTRFWYLIKKVGHSYPKTSIIFPQAEDKITFAVEDINS